MSKGERAWTGQRGQRSEVHLDVLGDDAAAGGARREEIGGGDEGGQDAGHGGEEAEDVLQPVERVVHDGARAPAARAGRRGGGRKREGSGRARRAMQWGGWR